MASTSAMGNGLYMFGGFGLQGYSPYYNPYTAFGQGVPSYRQNPAGSSKENPGVSSKQNPVVSSKQNPEVSSKQLNPTGYNMYNDNDDRIDQNFYPLSDAWYLSYM